MLPPLFGLQSSELVDSFVVSIDHAVIILFALLLSGAGIGTGLCVLGLLLGDLAMMLVDPRISFTKKGGSR